MLVTTTNHVEGHEVVRYLGLVAGEVVNGVDFIKDFGAGMRNFFGGRSQGYEEELINAREAALNELQARAEQLGANAVIGAKFDYTALGQGNNMLMVTVVGTAVQLS
ncbi:hypothetical protein BK816_06170 [Boudabousia tangfeifanii]|uniref:UPF0145 protein BK816_06170 n=1 Tax=Boudabousia tangfeifanii TaxID=1912795 RepID=A0A1D9MKT9_9ACTO|nr:YbjQ family protein [Boudabousia tangfeifanii]AOZ72927.1 hypothetical protein BK816_06170 [Boudabousia tangfeifanii]